MSRSASSFGPEAAGGASPSTSADGRYVAFTSSATVVRGQVDPNGGDDVFLLDRTTGVTKLVSHAFGSTVRAGNSTSGLDRPAISADGRLVVFSSFASDLVPGFTGEADPKVYLYSRLDESMTLVSRRAGVPTSGYRPVISGDGAFVAYMSCCGNSNVYLFEVASGKVDLVSHAFDSQDTEANGGSGALSISHDGRRLAFDSWATNLVPGNPLPPDYPYDPQVYLYDRIDGLVRIVSDAAGSAVVGNGRSSTPAISADGRFVAFSSDATNLVPGQQSAGSNVFLFATEDGAITLVSHAWGSPHTGGDGASAFNFRAPAISAGGGAVAFDSLATNLVPGFEPGTGPGRTNVFLYSRTSGTVTLVSHRPDSAVHAGNDASGYAMLSADGSAVAFASQATDLVAGLDANWDSDAFLYVGGEVTLVSHTLGQPGTAAGVNSFFSGQSLSADGLSVAFTSRSADVTADADRNGQPDVFLMDRVAGAVALVSLRSFAWDSATAAGAITSWYAGGLSTSADGRYVAFASTAPDLVPGQVDPGGVSDVFRYDRQTSAVRLVSHLPGQPTTSSGARSTDPAISADGRYVAFTSGRCIHLWSREDDSLEVISGGGPPPFDCANQSGGAVISADGRHVAFWTWLGSVIVRTQVYLWSRDEGVRLVTHAPGQPTVAGNQSSMLGYGPIAMSRDARFIAFDSSATNLVGDPGDPTPPTDTNYGADVFLYSRETDSIELVSHAWTSTSTTANGASHTPSISADGGIVAFTSEATNLGDLVGFGYRIQTYFYRRATGEVRLVSHAATSPLQVGFGHSSVLPGPAVSADGSQVAFASSATNLVAGTDSVWSEDVFLYSTADGAVKLVSHRPGEPSTALGGSSLASARPFSGDGGTLVFSHRPSDLAGGTGASTPTQTYLYTAATGENTLVSGASDGISPGNGASRPAVLSQDGRWVAFGSLATDLVPNDLNSQADAFLYGPARPGADLSVGVAVPASATPPGPFPLTVVIVNLGLEPAREVSLSLLAPAGLSLITTPGGCTSWPCGLGTLAPGQFRVVTLNFAMPSSYVTPDPAVIDVTANSWTPDPEPTNNTAGGVVAVLPRADLELHLTGRASATPPDQPTYTMVVTNRGPSDAVSVQLGPPTPQGLTLVGAGPSCPVPFPCPLGNLPPGESRTVTATYLLPETYSGPDPIHGTGSTSSSTVDPNAANNSAFVDTLLDSATPALGFFTVSPCRLVDTRWPDGPMGGPALGSGAERWFTAVGSCGIPASARAVALNVTVTETVAPGNVRLWAAGKPMPDSSVVTYRPAQTRGASTIVGLNVFGILAARVGSGPGTVHLILDVSGYFE